MSRFAHIITDSSNEQFVREQWEQYTGEKISDYNVVKTTLGKVTLENQVILKVINSGRKNKQLVWIKAFDDIRDIPERLAKELNGNVLFILKDGTVRMDYTPEVIG